MDSLTELYCLIDDFCRAFEPAWERHLLATGAKRRQRPSLLSLSELMTLAILSISFVSATHVAVC